jgi:hypothetical protein
MSACVLGKRDAMGMDGAGLVTRARRRETTYVHNNPSAEPGASVKPVIVLEFVYFYALAIVGRRGDQGHNRGVSLPPLRPGR